MPKWKVIDAFAHFGAETNNSYAWSAQSADGATTVITLWQDEIEDDGTKVRADFFNHPKLEHWVKQPNNKGRKRHLQNIWEGDKTFKVVMLKAKDVDAKTRSAKERWPDDNLTMTLLDFNPETGEFLAEGVRTKPIASSKGEGWTDQELAACVAAYRELWLAQEAGTKVNKSALRRAVVKAALQARGESAYEFRMQNISAVIDELGLGYVQGYLPLRNVGAAKDRIIELINEHWDRTAEPEAPTSDPDELATRVESATQKFEKGKLPQPSGSKAPARTTSSSNQFVRDPNVIAWVCDEADGHCDACEEVAPFNRADGSPYLEVHHIRLLAEGGPDTPDNAIAGCPNCHRRLHHAEDRDSFRKAVIAKVSRLIDYPKRSLKA
ncbi:HNH endonuclease [Parasphingorhabdus sp.]|uniref:HNH endonuclease n=1 Tax=Parasphingorhabdus sp. TaxID=2709688 RepID=UPI002F9375DA